MSLELFVQYLNNEKKDDIKYWSINEEMYGPGANQYLIKGNVQYALLKLYNLLINLGVDEPFPNIWQSLNELQLCDWKDIIEYYIIDCNILIKIKTPNFTGKMVI